MREMLAKVTYLLEISYRRCEQTHIISVTLLGIRDTTNLTTKARAINMIEHHLCMYRIKYVVKLLLVLLCFQQQTIRTYCHSMKHTNAAYCTNQAAAESLPLVASSGRSWCISNFSDIVIVGLWFACKILKTFKKNSKIRLFPILNYRVGHHGSLFE